MSTSPTGASSPTDINDLKSNDAVTVAEGAGAEIRYWVAVLRTTRHRSSLRSARRWLRSSTVQAIAETAYDGTVDPLYSIVPSGLAGSNEAFKDKYGEPRTSTRPSRPSPTPESRRRST